MGGIYYSQPLGGTLVTVLDSTVRGWEGGEGWFERESFFRSSKQQLRRPWGLTVLPIKEEFWL